MYYKGSKFAWLSFGTPLWFSKISFRTSKSS